MHNRFDLFRQTGLGRQLEALICAPQRYSEYAALSRAGLPAVTALVHELAQHFPELETEQTARQFCGAMVGEVMRQHGHQLLRARGRVPGGYFSYGAVWSALPVAQDFASLLQQFAGMPERVARKLGTLAPAQRTQRPAGSGFCALEHLCHLRDLDRDAFLPRVQAMLHETLPTLHSVNGSLWAEQRQYLAQDYAQAAAGFVAARASLLAVLENCGEAEQQRLAVWNDKRLDLKALLADMVAHDATHLLEIDELLLALQGEQA